MLLILNTGAVAGSCSLWVLAPRELGFVLSESYQQRFLLALGYKTQLCAIAEQRVAGKPPLKCGVTHTLSSRPEQGCESSP